MVFIIVLSRFLLGSGGRQDANLTMVGWSAEWQAYDDLVIGRMAILLFNGTGFVF